MPLNNQSKFISELLKDHKRETLALIKTVVKYSTQECHLND